MSRTPAHGHPGAGPRVGANGATSSRPTSTSPSKRGAASAEQAALAKHRVVIALDLDAFYVAASRKRDPSLVGLPVGIKQKHILATASYEARARGVKKLALIKDAVRQCPELVLVNGEDLTYFRDVSAEVFRVVSSLVEGSPVEKLGMDELFIDSTELVTRAQQCVRTGRIDEIAWLRDKDGSDPAIAPEGFVLPESTLSFLQEQRQKSKDTVRQISVHTHKLLLASHLAFHIRCRVAEIVGVTSSAGVANSKLLAKLVGNSHKPNRQTTFAPLGIALSEEQDMQAFLDPFPLRSLNGFGSVIVAKMCAHAIKALGGPNDAFDTRQLTVSLANQIFDLDTLQQLFGARLATRLNDLLHACDDEPVIPAPEYPSQISIEDTYQGLPFEQAYTQFLRLSESLLRRLEKEIVSHGSLAHRGKEGLPPVSPNDASNYRLVMQGYDTTGDPLPASDICIDSAPMKVRDYEEREAENATLGPSASYQWRRYPLSMRLSVRQGYTNRISRQTRMPVEIFSIGAKTRKQRAAVLAQSANALFKAMIASEGDRGEGLNLINIAALDLSVHRPASSLNGFFGREKDDEKRGHIAAPLTNTKSEAMTSDEEDLLSQAIAASNAVHSEAAQNQKQGNIDLAFLAGLPEELRAEIATQYGIDVREVDIAGNGSSLYDNNFKNDFESGSLHLRERPNDNVPPQSQSQIALACDLVCSVCGNGMSPWLQHDHARWPELGLSIAQHTESHLLTLSQDSALSDGISMLSDLDDEPAVGNTDMREDDML